MNDDRTDTGKTKGSVLLVTLLLAMIMGSVAIGYLRLTASDIRVSDSAYLQNALLNLAEAGAEEATWVLNNEQWDTWVEYSAARFGMRTGNIDLGTGRRGSYIVALSFPDTSKPMINVESTITLPGGRQVSKQIEIELQPRSLFSSGMVAKDTITMSGEGFTVDSFDSSVQSYQDYLNSADGPNDNGSIGSASMQLSVNLSHANIFGSVSTGGVLPQIGNNGKIWGKDTDWGNPDDILNGNIDKSRVSTDFSAEFKAIDVPPPPLVYFTDVPGFGNIRTMGVDGAPTYYLLDDISLTGGRELMIHGDVTLVVTGSISMGGQSRITLAPDATVNIYVQGDFTAGGTSAINNGTVDNPGLAKDFVVYGTNPTEGGQNIRLQGNGQMAAAVYAPNAIFSMNGGGSDGSFYGAVVAHHVVVNGAGSNYGFHYDEALAADFSDGSFKMVAWRELTAAADRYDFSSLVGELN